MMLHVKRFLTALLIITILSTGFNLSAQTKDVDVTRSQLWLRGQLKIKTDKNWGVIAMAASRYNPYFTKEVNGVVVDEKSQNAWLQELWAGPFFTSSINPSLQFSSNLLYRPQFWYIDEEKEPMYVRHTVTNAYTLTLKKNAFAPHFRLMLWHQLPALQPENVSYNYELLVRTLLGLHYKVNDVFSLTAQEELFLKPTADETDVDGSEIFHKNALWLGFDISPSKSLTFSLRYVPFYTNSVNNDKMSVDVNDHYLYVEVIKSINLLK